jgi:arylsulfatase A-like enzyme
MQMTNTGFKGDTLRFSWLLDLLLICGSTAVVIALGSSASVIIENRYVSLGFSKGVLVAIQSHAAKAIILGLVCAVVLWMALNVLRLLGYLLPRLGFPIPWKTEAFAYFLTPFLALLIIGVVSSFSRGGMGDRRLWMVTIGALAWCIMFGIWRHLILPRAHPFIRQVWRLGLYALPIVLLVFAFVYGKMGIHRHVYVPLLVWLLVLAALYFGLGFPLMKSRKWVAGIGYLLLLLVTCAPLYAWASLKSWRPGPLEPSNPKNVIVIGIDTLRWDHTSIGKRELPDRDTTPFVRELAEHGTVFERAISQSSWTMPAFASILTGKYPRQHGAISLTGSLRAREVTLAEILREAGYTNGGVVSTAYVDSRHGFSQGFDDFNEDNCLDHWAITSEAVTNEAMRFLKENEGDRFFLFVHYYDPHYEFRNHEDWTFADWYDGRLLIDRMDIQNLRLNGHLMQSEDLRYLRDLYDEEIVYTDQHIHRLVMYLQDEGLDSETALIIVADHGEEFMERGWLGHTITLHDEITRVPFFIVLPGMSTVRSHVEQLVETRAIFSTILDFLGINLEGQERAGSLLPVMQSASGSPDDEKRLFPAYSEVWLPDAPIEVGKRVQLSSCHFAEWKLIRDHRTETEYLYNLKDDPLERNNLVSSETDTLKKMHEILEAWLKMMPTDAGGESDRVIDEELRERLRSLGYM